MSDLQHQAKNPPGTTPPSYSFASAPTEREARQIIGDRVRAARIAANMTQQELAGQTVSKSYISAVERGKMTPSFQALGILAERLGVTISSILGEEAGAPTLEAHKAQPDDEQQAAPLNQGELFLQQDRYEEALDLFAQARLKDRLNRAREQYAQFLAAQGRYQEAYEQIALALREAGT